MEYLVLASEFSSLNHIIWQVWKLNFNIEAVVLKDSTIALIRVLWQETIAIAKKDLKKEKLEGMSFGSSVYMELWKKRKFKTGESSL